MANTTLEQIQIDAINKRLSNHDDKLDKLVEIATILSRIEERSVNQHDLTKRVISRLDDIEERTEEIEKGFAQMRGGSVALRTLGAILIAVGSALATWFSFTPNPPP